MDPVRFLIYVFSATTALSMVRVVLGPSVADRMVGLTVVASQVLGLLVLIAVDQGLTFYLDVALVYDIFGFIGILAITRYVGNREEQP
ncbi:multicomponent Na+:H+ antiporter subunit F [Alkalispirochaeta americana]|uniref:Multicomponent Na+:H+ antiporter subunit F n=1 Tax=Alkalispirochaeta americana TaxID=159291 RepID=A0A1N6T688_9SPIO|nr:monovalent cation/H+ antiporter complex subunit F [Alkalispirochaeta americana]SIQ48880.1 multicomponent Na+:H+ antiporter subunit F [Alkalispirochaeta americana]